MTYRMMATLLLPLAVACTPESKDGSNSAEAASAAVPPASLATLDHEGGPTGRRWLALDASYEGVQLPRIGEDIEPVKSRLPLEAGSMIDYVVKKNRATEKGWRLHAAHLDVKEGKVSQLLLHSTGPLRCAWMREQLKLRFGPPERSEGVPFKEQWKGQRVQAEYQSMKETSSSCYVRFWAR